MSDLPRIPGHGPAGAAPTDRPPVTEVERSASRDPPATDEAYRRLVERAGRLDRSGDGKLALSGEEAASFLTGQVTADVEALEPGGGTYAALLDVKGKIRADLRILRTDEELLLICERPGLQTVFDHLRRHLIGFRAELHKRTLQRGLVAVIGPDAPRCADAAAAGLGPREHDHVAATLEGTGVRLVRTDVGVDLLCDAEDTSSLAAALEARGAMAVTDEAAEVVRVESGRPRLGADIAPGVMPAEAGIVERAVSFTKGCYVGQETVARLHWRGRPNRRLCGLLLQDPVPVGSALHREDKEVGRLSSSVRSPRLGPIGLALLRREVQTGDTIAVRPESGAPSTARVVELPFNAPDLPPGPLSVG